MRTEVLKIGKRLLDALSWLSETWKISIMVKDAANGRCLVDMYIMSVASARALAIGIFAYILREASALFARSTMMGNSRASESGTSNKYGSHAFFF